MAEDQPTVEATEPIRTNGDTMIDVSLGQEKKEAESKDSSPVDLQEIPQIQAIDTSVRSDLPSAIATPEQHQIQEPETPRFVEFNNISAARPRTDSQSTTATTATRPSTRSSLVFVTTALETIAQSKDAKRNKKLGDSTQQALTAIKDGGDPSRLNPEILFLPLQLASEATTFSIVITALDCIGKLISYSYFSNPAEQPSTEASEGTPLIERAIDTICDCFQGEATQVDVQLQIVKSLLAAILNDKIVVHGAGLLKAVRLTYNIFLLSKSGANQQVSQGALTQMVGTVFERVKTRLLIKESRLTLSRTSLDKSAPDIGKDSDDVNGSVGGVDGSQANEDQEEDGDADMNEDPSDVPVDKHTGPKITLQSFENSMNFNDERIHDNAPTLVTRVKARPSRAASGQESVVSGAPHDVDDDEEDEIYIRDAYLVFRAMCRLSTKPLPVEHAQDIRSPSMRSKLLSLHIIHTILHNNIAVFISPFATIQSSSSDEPTPFIQAIKQYLCLSLSRNGASSISRVFEVSCEIFWQMLKYLRIMLKKEIEVFLKEIYLATLEKRTSAFFQKQYILTIFGRLAEDPRALVEVYLNYDCDRTALDNMYQRVVENLARVSSTPVLVTAAQQQIYREKRTKQSNHGSDWQSRGLLPPSLATAAMHPPQDIDEGYPPEYAMKQEALESLVQILRSLVNWSQEATTTSTAVRESDSRISEDFRGSVDTREGNLPSPSIGGDDSGAQTPMAEDDPNQIEREKQRKTALTNAVKQFNYKPKRGLKALLKDGFIQSNSPQDIAKFFMTHTIVDKKALGEFLGEGDPENIAIMHAFVDLLDFTKTRFVDALRRFLQCFRLPGEAQKIDRFMLKFAERYITGNPNAYANADTAYVLSYSVIMLNVDQHSKKMKGKRMTPEDFIKNNRGINDNADLPEDYLRGIYDDISHNEIVLEEEQEAAANAGQIPPAQTGGIAAGLGLAGGRDLQREAYMQASEEMANKTEQLYKNLLRAQRRGAARAPVTKFIPATSFKHVGPMLEVTWMPFLTALSAQAQDTNNLEIVRLCMEGLKLAIRLACVFDLENPRQAFVQSLSKFTNLYNLSEMKAKNVEALKVLLDVAQHEGDHLKESWRDILTCVSQLDRFQLISTGVDEGVVPDVLKANVNAPSRKATLQVPPKGRGRSQGGIVYETHIAEESRSADIIRSVDRIFTNTANLSGEAIVHFVRALTQVSWQEIQSSGQSESPRTYSLQKLVEISGYNMTRVRFEWTNIWQILGEHFNQVGCHNNTNVVYFALNALRQLSMRFMEIEELPGFKFQKDFLKPFEHIIANSNVVMVKDMVLRCLIQMIQARGQNIRSGWKTMFGVFTVAAQEPYEGIVNLAFDNVTQVYNSSFGVVISQGAFADLIVCLTQFSKNHKFQKKSLSAIETLKSAIPKMLRTPECPLSHKSGLKKEAEQATALPKQPSRQTQEEEFWFPVLFAFHDVLMTGEDLEVRSRALSYLFETLIRYGGNFPQDFWDTLWRQLLYPIFMVLKSKSEMSKVLNHEELSVWLSTTMIQALRHMINLFTHFFESLEYMLDRFLDLLTLCICQENDTLARIGSNCLQQLVLQNVDKFDPSHWNQIVSAFVELFDRTEATALFSAVTSSYAPPQTIVNGTNKTPTFKTPDEQSLSGLSLGEIPADEKTLPQSENPLGINGLSLPRRGSSVSKEEVPSQAAGGDPASKSTTELEDYRPESELQQAPVVVTAARRRYFNQIITKCVLQLLMIETVQELFTNDTVYQRIPSTELLQLMQVLKKSFFFAKKFNADRELRTRLFKEGFMKQPPNLLKQESGSAAVYVSILLRMYHDTSTERAANRVQTESALVPLCEDIVQSYIELDEETQQRNILTWRPVVVNVLEGFLGFAEDEFKKFTPMFTEIVVGLLGTGMAPEVQKAVQALTARCFEGLGVKSDWGSLAERGSISPRTGTSPNRPRRTSRNK
ncbi:hypothetical protein EJ05DRAFT_507729 [Pseudovirgaria hyperparasitica]|uniref:SEC7 domain-containing protein n=1 Tax=Pseudovirgaria hyperparasitica TaxID=470096 RepID=A0A6A6WH67_9PEZI|nr:uncharacterized protein EJ05DRAFT_507729 [Pseudovirgaria hyperparasitica]KAF2762148.1 hypothetical protein EJ05DRAFT_507729 [Pseudovirgaria hyperparasitica]